MMPTGYLLFSPTGPGKALDMVDDPEIKAMSAAYAVIEPLDAEAQSRVLTWLQKRLNVSPSFDDEEPDGGSDSSASRGRKRIDGDPIAKIASALSVTQEEAELLMNLSDDAIDVDLPPAMLPDSDSKSMRELALVIGAAAEAAGRTFTRENLKTVMRSHNRDPKNVNRDLGSMKQVRLKNDALVLLKEGREQAGEIAGRWAGRDG